MNNTAKPLNESDVVRLKQDKPELNLTVDMLGAIVMVYNFPPLPLGYEVEFVDSEGYTLALVTVKPDEVELVIPYNDSMQHQDDNQQLDV